MIGILFGTACLGGLFLLNASSRHHRRAWAHGHRHAPWAHRHRHGGRRCEGDVEPLDDEDVGDDKVVPSMEPSNTVEAEDLCGNKGPCETAN